MIDIPLRIEFPNSKTSIPTTLRLHDVTYVRVFEEIVKARGWIGIEQAAEIVGLSPSRFSHVFSRTFGVPFRTVQRELRLEVSAIAVMRTRWRMGQIATLVHYSDLKKWSAAFCLRFEISPSHYRKRFLRNPFSFDHKLRLLTVALDGEDPAAIGEKAAATGETNQLSGWLHSPV